MDESKKATRVELRVSYRELAEWKAVLGQNETLTAFIREAVNSKARKLLGRRFLPLKTAERPVRLSSEQRLNDCIVSGKEAGKSWLNILKDVHDLGFTDYSVHQVKDKFNVLRGGSKHENVKGV